MTDAHTPPTANQWEQSGLVQAEMLEVIDRLMKEGIDWRIVLTGTSTALANLLMAKAGPEQVPVHFARLSAQTMHLAKADPG